MDHSSQPVMLTLEAPLPDRIQNGSLTLSSLSLREARQGGTKDVVRVGSAEESSAKCSGCSARRCKPSAAEERDCLSSGASLMQNEIKSLTATAIDSHRHSSIQEE